MKTRYKLMVALAVILVATGTTVATDKTDVMTTVHQFVDGFNKGDTASALAACADQTSIIDEFPPHEWHGAGACETWLNDYEANAKANGITDGIVTIDKPWHLDVTGDHAYVVVRANYTYKEKGKPMKETGSAFIFALQKGASGWRITGWAWGAK